jgi:hypothetical protein
MQVLMKLIALRLEQRLGYEDLQNQADKLEANHDDLAGAEEVANEMDRMQVNLWVRM